MAWRTIRRGGVYAAQCGDVKVIAGQHTGDALFPDLLAVETTRSEYLLRTP
jgi:hypothetical protein